MSLCMDKRGVEQSTKNIDNERIMIQFLLPLNEIIVDFYDELKSLTSGFASFDYEDHGYQTSNIVKVINYFLLSLLKTENYIINSIIIYSNFRENFMFKFSFYFIILRWTYY